MERISCGFSDTPISEGITALTLSLLIVTFTLLTVTMLLAARSGRPFLYAFVAATTVASNITLPMQISLPVPWLGTAAISLGVLIYSMNYLATDICSEYGARHEARNVAILALLTQILFTMYIALSLYVAPTSESMEVHGAVGRLFSTTPRITVATIVSSAGAFFDIWIYEYLRRRHRGRVLALAFRNNVSTVLGQGLNTVVFFTIAFYGVFPNLMEIILTAWLAKCVIAFCDTPVLYIAQKFRPSEWR